MNIRVELKRREENGSVTLNVALNVRNKVLDVPKLKEIMGIEEPKKLPSLSYTAEFWGDRKAEVHPGEEWILMNADISEILEITPDNLTEKEGYPGVLHSVAEIACESKGYKAIIEYMDLPRPDAIEEHGHPEGVEEIYASLEEPYEVRLCKDGETHSSFAKKQLAVKIIPMKSR